MTEEQTSHNVLFHRLAATEYIKARRWYAREGGDRVADRLRDEVDEAVKRIAGNPYLGSTFRKAYRWVRIHRFPYLLYYQILDESRVMILAVAHAARRPGYWLRRAREEPPET
ncbi:MAG: type II toxin-antitoxin system RelE/ParE family toxin [Pirellulales bacterium]